jgi:hypothetical protein
MRLHVRTSTQNFEVVKYKAVAFRVVSKYHHQMRKVKPLPPQATLRTLYTYDPETGLLCHAANRIGGVRGGERAGKLRANGYRELSIFGQKYKEHRVIWQWMRGECPYTIDHKNADRADNRWCNLQEVSDVENCRRRPVRKDSSTGVKGLFFDRKKNRYYGERTVAGKRKRFGTSTHREVIEKRLAEFEML